MLHLRSIFTCRNSSKKNMEDKIKINACNHPTPKVHIYLQKQLKIDENVKINPCNHPTPKVVKFYLQYIWYVLKGGMVLAYSRTVLCISYRFAHNKNTIYCKIHHDLLQVQVPSGSFHFSMGVTRLPWGLEVFWFLQQFWQRYATLLFVQSMVLNHISYILYIDK